jgi:quinone-modifying oxidoreductase subunit QmoB
MMQVAISEYDKLPDMINAFVERVKEIGPNPFKGF